MTLPEIKAALAEGRTVCWSNTSYRVIKDSIGQYLIVPRAGSVIGLTWCDGVTLNGAESEFFILEEPQPCK